MNATGARVSLDSLKLQIWSLRVGGHLATLLFAVSFFIAMNFIPASSPLLGAEEIAAIYERNAGGIRIGVSLMILGFTLWLPWAVTIACWIRRVEEGSPPFLTYLWLITVAVGVTIVIFIAFFWAAAAFRPGEIDPGITQTFHDLGWLLFLIPWPPFSLWAVIHGLVVLRDRSERPMFPRWVAGWDFWAAFIFIPAAMPLFFKTTGFAYNGLLGNYFPVLVYWLWMEIVTYKMIQALQAEIRSQSRGSIVGAAHREMVA